MRVWLERTVKLPLYINNFVDNGHGDMNIAAEMITDDKLIKIGINPMGYREFSYCKLSRYNKLMRNFAV